MLASDPTEPKRTDRKKCPDCGATPGGCAGLHFVGGRYCCAACEGNHDEKEVTE